MAPSTAVHPQGEDGNEPLRNPFYPAAELKRLNRLSGVARKLKLLDNIAPS